MTALSTVVCAGACFAALPITLVNSETLAALCGLQKSDQERIVDERVLNVPDG
jgi:hypothetical protein